MNIRGKVNVPGKWPTSFAAVPRPVELVAGLVDGLPRLATVIMVTHTMVDKSEEALGRISKVPGILVEVRLKD